MYYVLAFICGLVGSLAALRALELLVFGGTVKIVMFAVGVGFLLLARRFFAKARE